MIKGSLEEYKLMKQEIASLKSCVTTYFGYLIGGTGAALFGLGTFKVNPVVTPLISFLLSIVVSMLLLILLYKFNSHNRASGYCKLLNHERENEKRKDDTNPDLISWELCITKLRESDLSDEVFAQSVDEYKGELGVDKLRKKLGYLSGERPKIDNQKVNKGIALLLSSIRSGSVKSNSWTFPGYVMVVFFFISTLFFVLGCTLPFVSSEENVSWEIVITTALLVGAVQRYMWKGFLGKYYTLMAGSSTVDAFCWKFIPSRSEYLISKGISPTYTVLDGSLGDSKDYAHQQDVFHPKGVWGAVMNTSRWLFGDGSWNNNASNNGN